MNREIIFRGKRTGSGDWVEGSLLVYADGDCFICCQDVSPDVLNKYEVDPATVGQYTQLLDKTGKRVFEGDILEWIDRLVEVVWFSKNAQFDCNFLKYANDKIVTNFKGLEPRDWNECKIVGNRWDTHELLQE